jgi:hypothetical protein
MHDGRRNDTLARSRSVLRSGAGYGDPYIVHHASEQGGQAISARGGDSSFIAHPPPAPAANPKAVGAERLTRSRSTLRTPVLSCSSPYEHAVLLSRRPCSQPPFGSLGNAIAIWTNKSRPASPVSGQQEKEALIGAFFVDYWQIPNRGSLSGVRLAGDHHTSKPVHEPELKGSLPASPQNKVFLARAGRQVGKRHT